MIRLKLEQVGYLIGGDAYTLTLMLRRIDHVQGLSAKKGFTLQQVLALSIVKAYFSDGQSPAAIRYAPSIFDVLSNTHVFALPADRLGLLKNQDGARFLAYSTAEQRAKAVDLAHHVIDVKKYAQDLLRKLLSSGCEDWSALTTKGFMTTLVEKLHPE